MQDRRLDGGSNIPHVLGCLQPPAELPTCRPLERGRSKRACATVWTYKGGASRAAAGPAHCRPKSIVEAARTMRRLEAAPLRTCGHQQAPSAKTPAPQLAGSLPAATDREHVTTRGLPATAAIRRGPAASPKVSVLRDRFLIERESIARFVEILRNGFTVGVCPPLPVSLPSTVHLRRRLGACGFECAPRARHFGVSTPRTHTRRRPAASADRGGRSLTTCVKG